MISTSAVSRTALRALNTRLAVRSSRFYSSGSTMHDGDAELLEKEKHKNLRGEQHHTSTPHPETAPGWNEHLASSSEAHVKADKHKGSPKDMQQSTVDYVRKRHHSEDSK